MTQKTGQKCTAIRRVLVPADEARRGRASDARAARRRSKVGDPAREEVRMGPVATAQQLRRRARRHRAARGGDRERARRRRRGHAARRRDGKGYFVGPRRARAPTDADDAHRCTSTRCSARSSTRRAATTATRHGGRALRRARRRRPGQLGVLRRSRLGRERSSARRRAWAGRLYLGSSKMAAQIARPGHRVAVAAPRRPRSRRRRRGARRRARPALLHAALRARGRRERAQVADRRLT